MRWTRSLTFMITLLLAAWPATAQSEAAARAALALHAAAGPASGQTVQRRPRPFRHAAHRTVAYEACHDMRSAHGQLRIRAPQDCELCHHREAAPAPCSRCHEAGAYASQPYPRTLRMAIAGNERSRSLRFTHTEHAAVPCAECHRGSSRVAGANSCAGCHADHHTVTRDCMACHTAPARDAHDVTVHVTCAGSGCHAATFVTGEPRTRESCLACHREQADHRPGESCTECHALPPFRRSGED